MMKKPKQVYDKTKTKKITNSFKMLDMLKEAAKTGTRLKASEISAKLGITNTRSIYYYRDTLQFLGYDVKSYGGYYGGYEYVPKEMLTGDELSYLAGIMPADKIELLEKIKRLNNKE